MQQAAIRLASWYRTEECKQNVTGETLMKSRRQRQLHRLHPGERYVSLSRLGSESQANRDIPWSESLSSILAPEAVPREACALPVAAALLTNHG